MKRCPNNLVAFLLVLVVLFGLGCDELESKRTDGGIVNDNGINKRSTVMMADTLRSIRTMGESSADFELLFADGERLRLSGLKGTVVVVNFWGSWCPPCRWEMPFFEEMWREYSDQGVMFIGIAVPPDTFVDSIGFAEHVGVTYPMGLDVTGKVLRDFGVTEFPTTFIFDRSGKQVRKFGVANKGVLRVYIKGQL